MMTTIGNVTTAQWTSKTVDWWDGVGYLVYCQCTPAHLMMLSRAANTSIDWIKLTNASGTAGCEDAVPAHPEQSGEPQGCHLYHAVMATLWMVKVHQNQNPDAVHIMDASPLRTMINTIFRQLITKDSKRVPPICCATMPNGLGGEMKQSDHFLRVLETRFGDNPNADSVPEKLREHRRPSGQGHWDILYNEHQQTEDGWWQGKSYLDKYKMEIYLLYQGWMARYGQRIWRCDRCPVGEPQHLSTCRFYNSPWDRTLIPISGVLR